MPNALRDQTSTDKLVQRLAGTADFDQEQRVDQHKQVAPVALLCIGKPPPDRLFHRHYCMLLVGQLREGQGGNDKTPSRLPRDLLQLLAAGGAQDVMQDLAHQERHELVLRRLEARGHGGEEAWGTKNPIVPGQLLSPVAPALRWLAENDGAHLVRQQAFV